VLIYCFDLIGVFAFAFLGARVGIRSKYNLLGVLTCAFLTALGGGTIRELLLSHTPFYFYRPEYLLVVAVATIASIVLYSRFHRLKHFLTWLDAIGITIFAYIGAHAAILAHLDLPGAVFFALLTACGGGVLCDLTARTTPHLFVHGRYALPPLCLAACYALLGAHGKGLTTAVLTALLLGAFFLQLGVAYMSLRTYRKVALQSVRLRQFIQNSYRIALARMPRS
jgi:uncharacterized membrane protein YeiH